jgi:hypothetical protein
MEPLSVYLTVDDRVDVVHCHKGWTLEQVRAATPHYSCVAPTVGRNTRCVARRQTPFAPRPPRKTPRSMNLLRTQVLSAHGGFDALTVIYTDDEGDEISIGSEAEYREALRFCEQEGGTWRISLELTHAGSSSPQVLSPRISSPRVASPPPQLLSPEPEPEPAAPQVEVACAGAAPCSDLVIRATVDGGDTVDVAVPRAEATFAAVFGRWGQPRVTYVDEEGDVITVGSEAEWAEALRCGTRENGVMRVDVALAPVPTAPAVAVADGHSGVLLVNVRSQSGRHVVRTTTQAPFAEVAELVGTAVLEYIDDDGDTITCSSAPEWGEALRFATRNSEGELQLDVTVDAPGPGGAAQEPNAADLEGVRNDGRQSMTDEEALGEALHGWLLARQQSCNDGRPPPPSPLAPALKLAEAQEWDSAAQKLTLDTPSAAGGSAGASASAGLPAIAELFVTESCWGTISHLPPPTEPSHRTKVTGSALLQVAHGTLVVRQIALRGLGAKKVRASRGKDGAVVRCAASSSSGTLSVKIEGEEEGVRLERGEEFLIQFAA